MSTSPRRTPLGACAACGVYGLSQHLSTCDPDRLPRLRPQLICSRSARPDPRRIIATREYERIRLDGTGELVAAGTPSGRESVVQLWATDLMIANCGACCSATTANTCPFTHPSLWESSP